ncbi:hypothetical protein KEM56_007298 [Ascosphaera pollenicola]|nr:hypothetical protein KEM56_007298 [Ascosphaera pollenicola]
MTPFPSIKRMHSKFIELMDYPIPNESVISRLSSSDAVSQNGAGPSGSFASVTEIRSGRRFEGEESSSSLNHYITDRSAVASPEPISEEHEPTTTHDMHSEQQRQISADEDSGIIVPSNDSVALARSLASVDSEGSWFSSRVSRSLSAKTVRTQAQIGRYKAASPRDGDPPKISIDSDVSDVDEDPEFDVHHEDDEEPGTATSSHSVLGEISIREGANKGGRVVVHPSAHLVAHASKAEIASTENIDEENDSDWEKRPKLESCPPNMDFGNKAEGYAVKEN